MLFSALLAAALVTLAAAAKNPPPTKRGEKCKKTGNPCPGGHFCPTVDTGDRYCYRQLSLGQPCYNDNQDCAIPGYCRYNFKSNEPGVCVAPSGADATCGGDFSEQCAKGFQCLTNDGNLDSAGKCIPIHRKLGETCNHDEYCIDELYCKQNVKGVAFGVCAPRAKLSEECGNPFSAHTIAPPCADGLGCFITAVDAKGICLPNSGVEGAKCSGPGNLYCDDGCYCKNEPGKEYGICQNRIAKDGKCSYDDEHDSPCVRGTVCYYEDDPMNGECLPDSKNPVGAKCRNWEVQCDYMTADCKTVDGKAYGKCVLKPAQGK